MVARDVEGARVVEIFAIPRDVPVKWDVRVAGKPNPAYINNS